MTLRPNSVSSDVADVRGPLVCGACAEWFTPLKYYNDGIRNQFCSRQCKHRARTVSGRGKDAAKRSYYLKHYGLTLEQADEMRAAGCSICGRSDNGTGRWGGVLHIDHDHVTGRVRGVLCHGCNVGIGHFLEDPMLLQAAIRYLAYDLTP